MSEEVLRGAKPLALDPHSLPAAILVPLGKPAPLRWYWNFIEAPLGDFEPYDDVTECLDWLAENCRGMVNIKFSKVEYEIKASLLFEHSEDASAYRAKFT